MYSCLICYGTGFDEYFLFDFVNNKNKKYRQSFITECKRFSYYKRLNRVENLDVFDDKMLTYKKFNKFYHRDVVDTSDKDKVVEFIHKHHRFIAKINKGSCGIGVKIVNTSNYDSVDAVIEELAASGHNILEELIEQSDFMASLHPQSVNTVRVVTVLSDKTGEVTIWRPFLKIGRNGSVVDNGGSGGIIVNVDTESGIVVSDGLDEANCTYERHPNTNITFRGIQLPNWEQAKEMVKQMAQIVPTNRYTGWDIAHTEKGWVMVEGNARGQFIGQQMCDKVGKRKEFESITYK